jgi:DNA repair exonuclease SbcCD nuclease subunit
MLRFLQLGDLHLGAKLGGLPQQVADELREAVRETARGAFAAAREQGLDLVLLPGDLFESDGIDPAAQLRFVYQLAEEISPIPVVIAPGNHDPFGPDSPYLSEQHPDNVFLFTSAAFQTLTTPAGAVTGRAYQAGEGYNRLDFSQLPTPPPEPRLLLLHASLLSAGDDRRHATMIAPLTEEALLGSGYAYTALGHFHNQREFRRGGDYAFAAYSGCPQGQGWDEPGAKGYIIGELHPGGAKLEFIPAAKHTFSRRELKLPALLAADPAALLKTLGTELRAALDPHIAVDLRVSGRWPAALREQLERNIADALAAAWHARSADYSRVEFHPELAEPGKSEVLDEFLSACAEGIEAAAADSAGADELAAWELAQHLGHRLLSGQGLPDEVAQ